MTDLVIGCPVFQRAWIIADWYERAVAAAEDADLKPSFVLVGDEVNDRDTFDAMREVNRHELVLASEFESDTPASQERTDQYWNPTRYERMAYLRNRMLGVVRQMAPQYFLSLDSDVLIHPEALSRMVLAMELNGWDAAGSRTYMDSTTQYPSYARLTASRGLLREDTHGTFPVDVIMAIKLMAPAAYAVDYRPHRHGEDIGWSIAAREAGLKLGWVGSCCSKHVMKPEQLREIDVRAGF